eukprot:6520554-Prymnesium_polylepis.1
MCIRDSGSGACSPSHAQAAAAGSAPCARSLAGPPPAGHGQVSRRGKPAQRRRVRACNACAQLPPARPKVVSTCVVQGGAALHLLPQPIEPKRRDGQHIGLHPQQRVVRRVHAVVEQQRVEEVVWPRVVLSLIHI